MEQLNNDKFVSKKMIAGRILPAIISFIVLVAIDQVSKYWIISNIALHDAIPVIPDVFELHYIQNPGTAWGLLANKQILFTICTIIVFSVCLFLYTRCVTLDMYKDIRCVLILIFSGGMGNFIDRIRFKYVIDFLYVKCIDFPVFNIADCYVTVSFFALILLIMFKYKEDDLEKLMGRKR